MTAERLTRTERAYARALLGNCDALGWTAPAVAWRAAVEASDSAQARARLDSAAAARVEALVRSELEISGAF